MHISWMMLRKQGAFNIQMLRFGCCFPPPVKIPGYMPVPGPTCSVISIDELNALLHKKVMFYAENSSTFLNGSILTAIVIVIPQFPHKRHCHATIPSHRNVVLL